MKVFIWQKQKRDFQGKETTGTKPLSPGNPKNRGMIKILEHLDSEILGEEMEDEAGNMSYHVK
jgi:hypothetical protein